MASAPIRSTGPALALLVLLGTLTLTLMQLPRPATLLEQQQPALPAALLPAHLRSSSATADSNATTTTTSAAAANPAATASRLRKLLPGGPAGAVPPAQQGPIQPEEAAEVGLLPLLEEDEGFEERGEEGEEGQEEGEMGEAAG
jgi:hypothetical protein